MLLLIVSLAASGQTRPARFNVRDFGAVGDGKTLDTGAIQKAIEASHSNGGGEVFLPAGTYLSGSILLKDGVMLHLDDKAVLLGSTNPDDYQAIAPFSDATGGKLMGWAFVGAEGASNVGIEGGGIIDGQGKIISTIVPTKNYGRRPFLVRFVGCHGVTLRDVQLHNSGAWTTTFYQCTDIDAEGVKVDSHVTVHNDGMDMDSCQRVKISDCDINSGDDAICLKATGMGACSDFEISGCHLSTHQGAIKLGTESMGDFSNIHVSHCVFQNVSAGGIKLLSVDGSHLTNITISDVTMDNVTIPIFIRLGARLGTFHKGDVARTVGVLRNVVIENIKARAAVKGKVGPPTGILISGIPGHEIEGLTLRNVEIDLAGGGTAEQGKIELPEDMKGYPEVDRFGKTIPAYGMYARHVNGLRLEGVTFKLAAGDGRPEVITEDVQGYERK